jgi:hypothetical protein
MGDLQLKSSPTVSRSASVTVMPSIRRRGGEEIVMYE